MFKESKARVCMSTMQTAFEADQNAGHDILGFSPTIGQAVVGRRST